MNGFYRLHNLRMENDAAGYAMEEKRPRFDRMAGRHENGTAPRAVSAYNLFQTPPDIAARLVGLLNLQPGDTVLEPSAGLGRLLNALPPVASVTAVEIAPQIAAELYRQERAGVTIKQRDFLFCSLADLGAFDAVAMNPPFHLCADVRHILHALKFLKRGGRLAALCLYGQARIDKLKPLSDYWEELPAGTFGKEGTRVQTVLLRITNK